jgi:hypothetical protein
MLSETGGADERERDIGTQLGESARANPRWRSAAIVLRSGARVQHECGLRARHVQTLARAKRVVEDMLERVRGAIERRLTDAEHRRSHRPSRAGI